MEAQLEKLISVVSTLIALQLVTLTTVVGVTWYSHKQLKDYFSTTVATTGRQPDVPERLENWRGIVREYNSAQGREDAAVVVVEYSDFQCPFCKKYSDETRRQIVAKYGDNLRMVFKHFPLQQLHPQAMTAAIAAQCARREGKFWEIHERFFTQPNALDVATVIGVGESLGLSAGYAECVINEETRAEVEQDIQDGKDVGVQGTPTLIVNGDFLVGWYPNRPLRQSLRKLGCPPTPIERAADGLAWRLTQLLASRYSRTAEDVIFGQRPPTIGTS